MPAYLSLTLSVLSLEAISWWSASIDRVNGALVRAVGIQASLIPTVEAGWPHIALIVIPHAA